jgi:hypothetical protein
MAENNVLREQLQKEQDRVDRLIDSVIHEQPPSIQLQEGAQATFQIGDHNTLNDNRIQISIEQVIAAQSDAVRIVDEVPDESFSQQAKGAVKGVLADVLKDAAKDATKAGLQKAADLFKDKAAEWATSPTAQAAVGKIAGLILGLGT